MAILGGSKVSDKIGVINNLLEQGRHAHHRRRHGLHLPEGAWASRIGTSICEDDKMELAKELLAKAAYKGVRIVLPVDNDSRQRLQQRLPAHHRARAGNSRTASMGLDIGPVTRELFAGEIARAKTVVWNGPVGVFEFPTFAAGTRAVAEAVAKNTGAAPSSAAATAAAAIDSDGPGRQGDPCLHRRRRFPGVPRGHRAARHRGAQRQGLDIIFPRAARIERQCGAALFLRGYFQGLRRKLQCVNPSSPATGK